MQTSFSLCPNCDACPEVTIGEDSVTIGEPGNQVRLTSAEWNVLVDAARTGKLHRLIGPQEDVRACDCGCECC